MKWSIPATMASGGPSWDPDAQAFIVAAGLSSATHKKAINDLVKSLKANSLWTKFYAIYPIVGGSSASHKYNLIDPRDLDAAYRLTFNGSVTHASTGIVSNGTTGYADTHFVPNVVMSLNDAHISFYSRTNITNVNYVDMGAASASGGGARLRIILALADGNDYGQVNSFGLSTFAAGTTAKYQILSRTTAAKFNTYDNGSLVTRADDVSAVSPNVSIYILAQSDGGVTDFYSLRECAFATLGTGLNATDASNLYTAVQAYQTTLGRQV